MSVVYEVQQKYITKDGTVKTCPQRVKYVKHPKPVFVVTESQKALVLELHALKISKRLISEKTGLTVYRINKILT